MDMSWGHAQLVLAPSFLALKEIKTTTTWKSYTYEWKNQNLLPLQTISYYNYHNGLEVVLTQTDSWERKETWTQSHSYYTIWPKGFPCPYLMVFQSLWRKQCCNLQSVLVTLIFCCAQFPCLDPWHLPWLLGLTGVVRRAQATKVSTADNTQGFPGLGRGVQGPQFGRFRHPWIHFLLPLSQCLAQEDLIQAEPMTHQP